MKGFECAAETMIGGIASSLAAKYSLDESEVYETLRRSMSVTVTARGETKRQVRALREEKPSVAFPWCGTFREGWCQGIRPQSGLFGQCAQSPTPGGLFCLTCAKKTQPTAEERSDADWSSCGKRPIRYANYLNKKSVTCEVARGEAEKYGVEIPEHEFVLEHKQRGRPRNTAAVSDTDSDGDNRPKRKPGRPKNSDGENVDLFSTLMAATTESDTEMTSSDVETERSEARAEKRQEAAAKKAQREAAKLENEQAAAAKNAAREAKVQEVADKKAQREAAKLEKEQAAAAKNAAREAKVQEVADKKAQREAAKLEKEQAAAVKKADREAKVQEAANKKAAREAAKLENEQAAAAKKADREANVQEAANKKAAREAAKLENEQAAAAKKADREANVQEVADELDEDDYDDEETKVVVWVHDGVKYLRSNENDLYDPDTQEHVGVWNETLGEIEDVEDDDEE